MVSFRDAILGGLVVFGLSFVIPWFKHSDPVYNTVPPWRMCAATSEEIEAIITQNLRDIITKLDLNTYIKNRTQEELYRAKSCLMKDLKARLREDVAKAKASTLREVEQKAINQKLRDLIHEEVEMAKRYMGNDIEASVQKHVPKVKMIQEVLSRQNDMLVKMEQKVSNSLHECVRVSVSMTNAERRWKASLTHTRNAFLSSWDHMRKLTLGKFGDVHVRQELMYDVIQEMGFMRSANWGVLILLMGAMQVILCVFICASFNSRSL